MGFSLQMIFFPEASDYISDNRTESIKLADHVDGSLISKYKSVAREHRIWISIGVHLAVSSEDINIEIEDLNLNE